MRKHADNREISTIDISPLFSLLKDPHLTTKQRDGIIEFITDSLEWTQYSDERVMRALSYDPRLVYYFSALRSNKIKPKLFAKVASDIVGLQGVLDI